jgi:hypothetical protein
MHAWKLRLPKGRRKGGQQRQHLDKGDNVTFIMLTRIMQRFPHIATYGSAEQMRGVQQYQALLDIGTIRGSKGEVLALLFLLLCRLKLKLKLSAVVLLDLAHKLSACGSEMLLKQLKLSVSQFAKWRQFLHLHLTRQQ